MKEERKIEEKIKIEKKEKLIYIKCLKVNIDRQIEGQINRKDR